MVAIMIFLATLSKFPIVSISVGLSSNYMPYYLFCFSYEANSQYLCM